MRAHKRRPRATPRASTALAQLPRRRHAPAARSAPAHAGASLALIGAARQKEKKRKPMALASAAHNDVRPAGTCRARTQSRRTRTNVEAKREHTWQSVGFGAATRGAHEFLFCSLCFVRVCVFGGWQKCSRTRKTREARARASTRLETADTNVVCFSTDCCWVYFYE